MGYNMWKEIESILGQSVYEHELVKDDNKLQSDIRMSGSIAEVLELLNKKHAKVYGRKKFLPGRGNKKRKRDERYIVVLTDVIKKALNDHKFKADEL